MIIFISISTIKISGFFMNFVIVIDNLSALEYRIRFIFLLTNKLVYMYRVCTCKCISFQNMNGYLR